MTHGRVLPPTRALTSAVIAAFVCAPWTAHAQRDFQALRGDPPINNLPYDGRFTFARLRYTVASGGYYYRGLPAWAHGYSTAEENLLAITHEVSLLDAHRDGSNVLAADDPMLFK